ncbi:MAG: LCP family protein [Caldilineales bacterium]|nr:LCP family protein [Caldilineales bacterium]
MSCARILTIIVAVAILSGCAASTPATPPPDSTAVAEATTTPFPTEAPTDTPSPTASPTASPTPTRTPVPTDTATATSTPLPSPTPRPTATPIIQSSSAITDTSVACQPFVDCIPTPAPPSLALENTENILLLGSDLRAGEGQWRTDTMLLVAIDWDNNRIGVLSFPRDYWLYVPGHPEGRIYDRINRPDFMGDYYKYPGGGFALLQEVFSYNFGIRLDRFARLHRQGFVDIVNTLGGVDVEMDCELWDYAPQPDSTGISDVLHLSTGPNHLDGETALKFATYRYGSNDYDRARRQQVLLLALRDQSVRAGTITQVPRLWGIFQDYFKTNLGLVDLLRLATLIGDINVDSVSARVISSPELEPLHLASGAAVVSSRGSAVHDAIESVFGSPSIFRQAHRDTGCLPTPNWAFRFATATPPPPTEPAPADTPVP